MLLIYFRKVLPLGIVGIYAFMTIRLDDTTVMDYIQYAESEYDNVDQSEKCFSDLSVICKKYDLPNYDRIIGMRDELVSSSDRFIVDIVKRDMVVDRILKLIVEVESSTKRMNGKADAYRTMTQMHNLPKALHGIDELGDFPAISPEEAMKYSEI